MRIIFVLIWAFVWAYICGAAMEKKRRESSAWYVLGFLFGGLAYIVILFIKPREPEFDEIEIQRMVAADKVRALKSDISTGRVWVCPQCNKMNDRYMTTCSCGTPKPLRASAQTATANPSVGTWTCNNCGMKNSDHIFICNCGMKKSENEMINKLND